MTDEDLTEWLETAIDDSFDLGWTSLDAAKLIVSRMRDEGLVIVKTEPVVWMYLHLATGLVRFGKRNTAKIGWTETPLYAAIKTAHQAMKGSTDADRARGTLADSDGDDGA
jgi:hypothetical protein